MKTPIDAKSAACGMIVGIAAILLIGADSNPPTVGRFQVATIQGANANQPGTAIMVDTVTGRAWGANIANDFKSGGFWDAKPK